MQSSKQSPQESIFGDNVDPQEARLLVERVLASQTLLRSPQLRNFLRYITDTAFQSGEAPTEQEIGVMALNRPPDYSPNDDNIVRAQARLLRGKLDLYFESEAPNEPLRISIPKGSYLPRFQQTASPAAPATPTPSRKLSPFFLLIPLLLACAIALFVLNRPADPAHLFWSQIFPPGQPVVIVPSDASLVVLQHLAAKQVPLSGYAGREYWHDLGSHGPQADAMMLELAKRRLTSLTSTRLAIRLAQLNEAKSSRLDLQYARDIKATSIDRSNLILLGAGHSNPWVSLFEPQSRILIRFVDGNFLIERRATNQNPELLFQTKWESNSKPVFGLISYLPNGKLGHSVLMIQGTGATGTDAASSFLFDDTAFPAFLQSITRSGRVPYFDLLIESKDIGGSAPTAKIVAHEVLSPVP